MIQLKRTQPPPQVLTDNKANWDTIAAREMATGMTFNKTSVSTNYNKSEVKELLLKDCNSKCMYCESKITHIDHGDIEHIKPKADFSSEAFEWNNLGLACAICNQTKSNYYGTSPVVDPYTEDPELFLHFSGQFIFGVPAQDRGQISVIKLGLNRPELLEQRARKTNEIYSLIDRAARIPDKNLRDAVISEAKRTVENDAEFSRVGRCFLEGLIQKLNL